jgi:hypothetical protein
MNPRGTREIADHDPTGENETLDGDSKRAGPVDDHFRVSLDYTGEFATGSIDHDDRGQARWKWNSESTPTGDTERTFDLLKALTNDALSIEGAAEEPAAEEPTRQSGYNPYNVGGPSKPNVTGPSKPKPRK